MAKENKPIVIEGHQLGWVPDYISSIYPTDGAEGQYKYSFGCSPVRPGRRGSIAPAEIFNNVSFTDAGSATNTLPRNIASDVNQTADRSLVITGGGASVAPKVILFDNTNSEGGAASIVAPNGNFSTLPSTGFWGEDVCFYPAPNGAVNTPSDYAFYAYNTSSHGYIGQYPYGSALSSRVDDFITTGSVTLAPGGIATLIPAVPHRMCVGSDRIMYVTNGQYIASYDGTSDQTAVTGTFNSYALDLGPGWMAVDVQAAPGYAIVIAAVRMGTNYNGPSYNCESRVIIWDGFSLDFNQVYAMDDWFIGSIKYIEGTLFAFTQGLNGTTKAKFLNPYMARFQTAWEALTSLVGNAPLPNQVEYFNGMVHFAGDTTTNMVFALMPTPTGGWALHTPYYLSTGSSTVTQTGFLKNVNSNILFAGVKCSSFAPGAGIMGVYGDGVSNGSVVASLANGKIQFRTKNYYTGYKGTITKIKAFFYQFDGSTSMYISMLPNKTIYSEDGSGNPVGDILKWTVNQANHPNIATTLTASTSELGGTSIVGTDVSNFWLNIRFTNTSVSAVAPIPDRLEIYYESPEKP